MGTPYAARRERLKSQLVGQPILLLGNGNVPRTALAAAHAFRQDSTFLYFTGWDGPDAAWLWDGEREHFFAPTIPEDDVIWHGPQESQGSRAERLGLPAVSPRSTLTAVPDACATLAVADARVNQWASRLLDLPLTFGRAHGSEALRQAVLEQRLRRDESELAAVRRTMTVTAQAHRVAMAATVPGVREEQLAGLVLAVMTAHHCVPAYHPILTRHGEILHQFHPDGTIEAEHLVLMDAGAEGADGYATDITRCWPARGVFDERQAAIYDLVLTAERAAIDQARAGVRYRDVHLGSARVLAAGLVELGLLRGDPDELVALGAHAVFYPHGVGHLLGLDVHDMENLGDIGYPTGRTRSEQFGLGYLRLDRDLAPGMVVTIEPGLYFADALIRLPALRTRLGDRVNWSEAERWIGLGGVRIEDDVLIRPAGPPEVLSASIPRARADIEAITGSAPELLSTLLNV